jgi:oligoendopeptidase F
MSILETLPHWDMTPIYPSMDSKEFANGFSNAVQDIENLAKLFDDYHVMKLPAEPAVHQNMIQAFETVIAQYNTVLEAIETLAVYIMCFVTTNSYDTLAQAKLSELQQSMLILSQLGIRLTAWIGSLNVEVLIERSPIAREHAFMLRKAKISAEHLMTPDEENLASELNLSAGTAWEKLHSDVTSQLMVSLELSGEKQVLPMSMVRNLASDPNREIRRSAYEAELEGWKRVSLPLAAALNSIKGEVNVLARRRGWSSPLEASLLDNNIDRVTFDAMLAAAYESFPDFRRYLRTKARYIRADKQY